MNRRAYLVACACFTISGACGLIYEVAWTRRFLLFLGVELHSIAIVVGTFMGGLALGSYLGGKFADKVKRPLLFYAVMELFIAAFAPTATFVIDFTNPLLSVAYQNSMGMYTVVRLVIAALLILPPATLMGATFPAMVKYATRDFGGTGGSIGLLYALNCGGAVMGTLLTGFMLLHLWGVTLTVIFAALLNVCAGLLAVFAALRLEGESVPQPEKPAEAAPGVLAESISPNAVLVAIFLQGMTSMILQVLWSKVLGLHTALTVYAFTSIVAAYILGLSLGSAFGAGSPTG